MADHANLPLVAALAAACCFTIAACRGGDPEPGKPAAHHVPAGRILFSQNTGGRRDIYAIKPDGRHLVRLTRSQGDAVFPDPSPDGHKIAYENDESTRAVIAVVDAGGGRRRVLTPRGFQGHPDWSPEGRSIAYERDPAPGDNGVWLMRADGSDVRRLTRNPYSGAECGCDSDPTFSPDGKLIAFARTRSESAGLGALFVMKRDGSKPRRLTSWRFDPGAQLGWNPDGSQILVSNNAHPRPGESSNLYTLRPDGTELRALTRFQNGAPNALPGSWSPDGRLIVLKTDESGDFQIYTMDAAGGNRHRITNDLSDPTGIVWGR